MFAPPMPTPELFSRHQIRRTRQRECVYEALCACESHPTAEELFGLVRDRCKGVSLATVYNTLDVLTQRGLCRRVRSAKGAGGPARYDADVSDHVHVLTPDGRVMDVPNSMGTRVIDGISRDAMVEIERMLGVRIARVNVEFVAAAGADASGPA